MLVLRGTFVSSLILVVFTLDTCQSLYPAQPRYAALHYPHPSDTLISHLHLPHVDDVPYEPYDQNNYFHYPFHPIYYSPKPPSSTTTPSSYLPHYPYISYPSSSTSSTTPRPHYSYPTHYDHPSTTESSARPSNGTRKTVLAISSIVIPVPNPSSAGRKQNSNSGDISSEPRTSTYPDSRSSSVSGRNNNNGDERTNSGQPSPLYVIVAHHNSLSNSENTNAQRDQEQNHKYVPQPTRSSTDNAEENEKDDDSNTQIQEAVSLHKYLINLSKESTDSESGSQDDSQVSQQAYSRPNSNNVQRQTSGSSTFNSNENGVTNARLQYYSINVNEPRPRPRYTTTSTTTTTTTTPRPWHVQYPPRHISVSHPHIPAYTHPVGPLPPPQFTEFPGPHNDLHHDPEKSKDYSFSYNIRNDETSDFKSAEETREGQHVSGSYSLLQPDGIVRTVRYYADPYNGFNALVENYPPHPPHPLPLKTTPYH